MDGHPITMLGTGLIGDFYTNTLHGQRGRDRVRVVYSRSEERGAAFSERWAIPESTTDLAAAIEHPDTDVVVVGAPELPPRGSRRPGGGGRQGRPVHEAARTDRRGSAPDARDGRGGRRLRWLPRGPVLHAQDAQGDRVGPGGAIGDVTWVRSRETHPGPHSAWFWDGRLTGGGAIIDLGCHCIEIIRNFVGKGNRPVEVLCHTDTLVHPIADEDNAVALIRFESGADRPVRGQLDVPRRDGPARRGRRHPRHDLAQPLPADRLRDVQRRAAGAATSPRRPRPRPAGCSRSATRSPSSATSTCSATCSARSTTVGAPQETFYDGYVVNAIMDAAYRSAKAERLGAGRAGLARRLRPRGSRRHARDSTRARSSSSARSCPTAGTSSSSRTPPRATSPTGSSPATDARAPGFSPGGRARPRRDPEGAPASIQRASDRARTAGRRPSPRRR